MISAKEAREKVKGCDTDFAKREQALVEEAINAAIQEGKYFVNIDGFFSFETKKWLTSLGYKVSSYVSKNVYHTHISW